MQIYSPLANQPIELNYFADSPTGFLDQLEGARASTGLCVDVSSGVMI